MKVYTYSEARQKLSAVLDIAKSEEVIIKRRGGETFKIIFTKSLKSPFDVAGVKTKATTKDILEAVRESRAGAAEQTKDS
ncbi:MAG: type II toxin-antitoxin system Phd/YefM family antitoxin [Desulfobacter sp.]|jgi:prevent-host-death family protein|uniref:type II toxin-antitoxin system prevent-host-death family antitoxin n=1 Tax=uncultured Desulfobacter sp. TaxID=240139 RepID=UPI0029C92F18|nr:type II toxin-antitoxin system prevent-host-death family antitoxin [uncultured Desulfobacter sp.]MCW8799411.1 type II toxin-antitoxin system Phd/YefM family antitoxin [Desulfobacter sp.]